MRPAFSALRALEHVRALVSIGAREASGASYREAAAYVAGRFEMMGYTVSSQRFAVPGGRVDATPVEAGSSQNVVAEPPGFDQRTPYLVVGGHLDTVPDSPGANDNASGIGMLLELARLAAASPPDLPVVFVAFGAEERRRQSVSRSVYALGAQAYLREMNRTRRASLYGMINLDMVGNGDRVLLVADGGPVARAARAAARRLKIPFESRARVAHGYSDHIRFEQAGYPVAWLWAGDHPTLHTPSDTLRVVERAQLRRTGRLAWQTIRTLRP